MSKICVLLRIFQSSPVGQIGVFAVVILVPEVLYFTPLFQAKENINDYS